jgi:tRNA-dihydrouridine synthase
VIAAVKAAVKIPVIGNGDVKTGADAMRMMEETGCDGVMIARGALGNPWIFREACCLWDQASALIQTGTQTQLGEQGEGACGFTPPTVEERIRQLLQHIDMVCADKGERMGVREMRKHIGWYTKGIHGAAQIRREANTIDSAEELKRLLQRLG